MSKKIEWKYFPDCVTAIPTCCGEVLKFSTCSCGVYKTNYNIREVIKEGIKQPKNPNYKGKEPKS